MPKLSGKDFLVRQAVRERDVWHQLCDLEERGNMLIFEWLRTEPGRDEVREVAGWFGLTVSELRARARMHKSSTVYR